MHAFTMCPTRTNDRNDAEADAKIVHDMPIAVQLLLVTLFGKSAFILSLGILRLGAMSPEGTHRRLALNGYTGL